MGFQSLLFKGDSKLDACAVSDPAHLTIGATGDHVRKVQQALLKLDGAVISAAELSAKRYGPSTAVAVLAYKTKRNIVNRRQQTKPDAIVGKMTVVALDAELLLAEQTIRSSPRIVAVFPSGAVKSRQSFNLRSTPSPAASRGFVNTSFAAFPRIVPPGNIRTMVIKRRHLGSFMVADGVGGNVQCLDESVGVVFDPSEPQAHGGKMSITRNPQSFTVLGKNLGDTFISASGTGSFARVNGDLLALSVVSLSTKLTWNPIWTPSVTNPPSIVPFMTGVFGPSTGRGIAIFGPKFVTTGTVEPDATISLDDFELGLIQNLISSSMVATYVDSAGKPTWTMTISERSLPIRDSRAASAPWMNANAVKSLGAVGGKTVTAEDRPRNVAPWQTKDQKGTLVSTTGADLFATWLAVRHKTTKEFTMLASATWSVDWSCSFDFKAERGTVLGRGDLRSQGDEGQGPFTPITDGKIANDEITIKWTGPAGGF